MQTHCSAFLRLCTQRAQFRWPQHRKHPAFERLRRAGTFLPADLTLADLTRVLEQARLDAIADLSAVGIVIANVPPADDSNSENRAVIGCAVP